MINRQLRKSSDVTKSMTERTRIPRVRSYSASITFRAKMSVISDIRMFLDVERLDIFGSTCFGYFLDLEDESADPVLIHSFLQLEFVPQNAVDNEIWFSLGDAELCYDREQFCLVTGLCFGQTPTLPPFGGCNSFVGRVFGPGKIMIRDLVNIFDTVGRGDSLSNEDAVRVCLLVMVEVFFLGRQSHLPVNDTLLRLIEDFDDWNAFPWGSYVWPHTFSQLHGAIRKRVDRKSKMTLSGFMYAFKVWILEQFPRALKFYAKHNRHPRIVRWQGTMQIMGRHVDDILSQAPQNRRLYPTRLEREAPWYISTLGFLNGDEEYVPSKRARVYARGRDGGDGGDDDDIDADNEDSPPTPPGHHDFHEGPPIYDMGLGDPYFQRWEELEKLSKWKDEVDPFIQQIHPVWPQLQDMIRQFGEWRGSMDLLRAPQSSQPSQPSSSPFQSFGAQLFGSPTMPIPHDTEMVDFYEATLTIKARISVAKDILVKLRDSDRRLALFRETCFGPWLDIRSTNEDSLLIHLILQTQFFPEGALADDMWFRIGGHELRFGREEFCLITGLRFGPMDGLPEISGNPFRERVFPDIPAHQHVKVSDLWSVFTSRVFARIPDLDAVRICLLLLLEVGFSGRQPNLVVAGFFLRLVEDLDSWNKYPWGSYLWALTHQQLKTALPRRQHHEGVNPDRIAKYTLTGFVFAFKIWIFETFPVARTFALRSDAIPRAIAWQWTQTIMWDMCLTFLDVDDDGRQPLTLTSTDVEREPDWWIDSQRFFDSVTDDFQPPTKRVRSYSPPRPARPPPPPISNSTGFGASSPEAATTAPTPLEQRVAALEQAVRDLQAGQRGLEVGQRDLEAGQRATQAGQRAILDSMARLHEMVQRALEGNHRTEVPSKNTRPRNVDDDEADGWP